MLPQEILENPSGIQQIVNEGNSFYVIEKVDFEDGTRVWIKGAEYHQKGMGTPDALFALNVIKRIVTQALKIGLRYEFVLGVVLIVLKPRKWRVATIQALMQSFNEICHKVVSPFIIKPKYMLPIAREVRSILKCFTCNLGIAEWIAESFSAIGSHIIEYDNAYRFRLEDLMSETTKEAFANRPIRELRKLSKIARDRDEGDVSWKFVKMATALSILLLIPSIKKAFREAILASKFELLQYDDVDRYWTAMRTDYKWWGLDIDERSKFNIGKKIPVPMPREEYERLYGSKKK